MRTSAFGALMLAVLMGLPAAGRADTLRLKDGRVIRGTYEGGSARVVRFRTGAGLEEYDVLRVTRILVSESGTTSSGESPSDARAYRDGFPPDEERIIRAWFSDRTHLNGLPPGLARRDSLPPGLQRQVQRNGTLPPGLQRHVHAVPADLGRRLPTLIEGISRVIIGGQIVLVNDATQVILDVAAIF